ncbi:hypothetical protein DCC79_15395, partial [bacterium]
AGLPARAAPVRGGDAAAGGAVEAEDDDTVTVAVRLDGVADVYGIDVTLRYDPARLQPLDGLANEPGIQAVPGAGWPDAVLSAMNGVDRLRHEVRFVASVRRPGAPLAPDAEVLTMAFRRLAGDPSGAVEIARVVAADPAAAVIAAHADGLAVRPGGPSARPWRLFLPYAYAQRLVPAWLRR